MILSAFALALGAAILLIGGLGAVIAAEPAEASAASGSAISL